MFGWLRILKRCLRYIIAIENSLFKFCYELFVKFWHIYCLKQE